MWLYKCELNSHHLTFLILELWMKDLCLSRAYWYDNKNLCFPKKGGGRNIWCFLGPWLKSGKLSFSLISYGQTNALWMWLMVDYIGKTFDIQKQFSYIFMEKHYNLQWWLHNCSISSCLSAPAMMISSRIQYSG